MGCSPSKREDVRFTSPQDIAQRLDTPAEVRAGPAGVAALKALRAKEAQRRLSPRRFQGASRKHKRARAALAVLDEPLVAVLRSGDIRLLCAAWLLKQPEGWRLQRRQDLEALEAAGERPFLSTKQANAALRKGKRTIAIISQCAAPPKLAPAPASHLAPASLTPARRAHSGWLKPGSPDPHGSGDT